MENPTENRIFGGYLYFRKPQFRGVPGVPHFQSSRHNCSALVADLKQFQRLQRSGEGLVLRARWINWIDEWLKMSTIVNKNMFFFRAHPHLSAPSQGRPGCCPTLLVGWQAVQTWAE